MENQPLVGSMTQQKKQKVTVQLNYKTGEYQLKEKQIKQLQSIGILEYTNSIIQGAKNIECFQQYLEKAQFMDKRMGSKMCWKLGISSIGVAALVSLPWFFYYLYKIKEAAPVGIAARPLYHQYYVQVQQLISEMEDRFPQFKGLVQFEWKNGITYESTLEDFTHITGQFVIRNYYSKPKELSQQYMHYLQQQQFLKDQERLITQEQQEKQSSQEVVLGYPLADHQQQQQQQQQLQQQQFVNNQGCYQGQQQQQQPLQNNVIQNY